MPDLEGAEAREREQRRDIHSGYGLHDVSLHALEGVPRRLSCRERGSVEHSVARFHLFVADVSVRDDTEHAAKGPADDDRRARCRRSPPRTRLRRACFASLRSATYVIRRGRRTRSPSTPARCPRSKLFSIANQMRSSEAMAQREVRRRARAPR